MSKHVFSTAEELQAIATVLVTYTRTPFASINIPGGVMEAVLGHVRAGRVLRTYDFVDVVNEKTKLGWQVKSTLSKTPVTWKRAKIPNARDLIDASRKSDAGLQSLGDAIIEFCNRHAAESLELYGLESIGYSRLVIGENGSALYFERELCSRARPWIFKAEDFNWRWSVQKTVVKKEQLQALHGYHRGTGEKWFAWHGLGENQLHFSGERAWWPSDGDTHHVRFQLATEKDKLTLEGFIDLLAAAVVPEEVERLSEKTTRKNVD